MLAAGADDPNLAAQRRPAGRQWAAESAFAVAGVASGREGR